jgi:hypothetical protein
MEFQKAVLCAGAGEGVEVRECDTIESWIDVEKKLGEEMLYRSVQDQQGVIRFVIACAVRDDEDVNWILLVNRAADNVTPEEVHMWMLKNPYPFQEPFMCVCDF